MPNYLKTTKDKYFHKSRLIWVLMALLSAGVAFFLINELFTELANDRSITLILIEIVMTISLSFLYWHAVINTYITAYPDKITIRDGFIQISIPWENIKRFGKVTLDDRNYESGLVLRNPLKLNWVSRFLLKPLFGKPRQITERVIILSHYEDSKHNLSRRIQSFLEANQTDN